MTVPNPTHSSGKVSGTLDALKISCNIQPRLQFNRVCNALEPRLVQNEAI